MRKLLRRGLSVLVDVVWFLFAALLIWRFVEPSHEMHQLNPWYHVVVRGGDITYENYWTTSPPPPVRIERPWFEYLNFTNANVH